MGEKKYIITESALRELIRDSLNVEYSNYDGDDYAGFLAYKLEHHLSSEEVNRVYNDYVNDDEDPNDPNTAEEILEDAGENILTDLQILNYKRRGEVEEYVE